jgi:hypothetical protein
MFCLVVSAYLPAVAVADPVTWTIRPNDNGYWQLARNGEDPFTNYGAGGWERLEDLVAAGGNSVRTWGSEQLDGAAYEEAAKLGLTVCAGLWMSYHGDGADYMNPATVQADRDRIMRWVRRYNHHPAIMMWGVGNELDVHGPSPQVYQTIEALAADIKAEDLNGYLDMATLPQRLDEYGWDKPFLVTEFGPDGPWEVEKSPWNAPLEPTSTEKARMYQAAYVDIVQNGPSCLGSYAFVWCDKQDGIFPWFNLQLPSGALLEPATALAELWSGTPAANRPPAIGPAGISIRYENSARQRKWYEFPPGAGASVTCAVDVTDADGGPLEISWRLHADNSSDTHYGEIVGKADGNEIELQLPQSGRTRCYRLSVVVEDAEGNAATASVPIRVSRYFNPI